MEILDLFKALIIFTSKNVELLLTSANYSIVYHNFVLRLQLVYLTCLGFLQTSNQFSLNQRRLDSINYFQNKYMSSQLLPKLLSLYRSHFHNDIQRKNRATGKIHHYQYIVFKLNRFQNSAINIFLVINSFIPLHRLMHLCFLTHQNEQSDLFYSCMS